MSVETNTGAGNETTYHALHNGTVIADRSDRLRMLFSGEKAAESLTGLVTNDVVSLTPGRGQYAAALTNKGKIIADVRIFARPDGFLVDASPLAGAQWAAMVKKFVNPRLAKYQDISSTTGDVGVFGPGARELIRDVIGIDVGDLSSYSHVSSGGEGSVMIARVPDAGIEGYDIIGPRDTTDALRSRFIGAGAIEDAGEALNIARVEAGRPEWGIDMDDTMLAQEMDMDRLDAISFSKGCYTGQETVARVHYRGHVNRLLRGLTFQNGTPATPGTPLFDESGKEVGVVKSGVISPRLGAVALALVRREVEPGARVQANAGQPAEARVVSLPFDGTGK